MLPSATAILTSPASSPAVSVVITVCAMTGWAASAKPLARLVTTKPRREKSVLATRLLICDSRVFIALSLAGVLGRLSFSDDGTHYTGQHDSTKPPQSPARANHREVIAVGAAMLLREGASLDRGGSARPYWPHALPPIDRRPHPARRPARPRPFVPSRRDRDRPSLGAAQHGERGGGLSGAEQPRQCVRLADRRVQPACADRRIAWRRRFAAAGDHAGAKAAGRVARRAAASRAPRRHSTLRDRRYVPAHADLCRRRVDRGHGDGRGGAGALGAGRAPVSRGSSGPCGRGCARAPATRAGPPARRCARIAAPPSRRSPRRRAASFRRSP